MHQPSSIPIRPVDLLFGGRREAIAASRCIAPPVGCGKSAAIFRDDLSRKEFSISGLCQACQDAFFGVDE